MTARSAEPFAEAIVQLRESVAARKCWGCGCFHGGIAAIERAIPAGERGEALDAVLAASRKALTPLRYDCLGCEVCFPAVEMNVPDVGGDSCPTEETPEREGWPPLPVIRNVLANPRIRYLVLCGADSRQAVSYSAQNVSTSFPRRFQRLTSRTSTCGAG